MNTANNTRRNFIKKLALAGGSLILLPNYKAQAISLNNSQPLVNGKGKVILFQGDSITDGNRGRDADPNHIMGHGYAFSIASRVGADYPEKQLHFINRGISANKIIDLEARWQQDTLDLKPDILSILIGINDSSSIVVNWEPKISTQLFEEKYDALLAQTIKALPEVTLVLCIPFILKVGQVAEHWEAYNADIKQRLDIVEKLAKKYNAILVDFQKVMNKACEKAPADYWMWDGIHPTVAGHELLTREWLKHVKHLI